MIFDDYDSLSFPNICLAIEEKPRKKPQPGKLTRPEIEPGPPRWEATILRLHDSGGLDFWGFSRSSPVYPCWSQQQAPLFNPLPYVIVYSHSVLFMSFFTSFTVRKNSLFVLPAVYNHVGWWGGTKRSAHNVLFHWILRLRECYLGENGSGMTDRHFSTKGPD